MGVPPVLFSNDSQEGKPKSLFWEGAWGTPALLKPNPRGLPALPLKAPHLLHPPWHPDSWTIELSSPPMLLFKPTKLAAEHLQWPFLISPLSFSLQLCPSKNFLRGALYREHLPGYRNPARQFTRCWGKGKVGLQTGHMLPSHEKRNQKEIAVSTGATHNCQDQEWQKRNSNHPGQGRELYYPLSVGEGTSFVFNEHSLLEFCLFVFLFSF